ncbi:glycosyltransferase family 1 protein [Xylariaceae sp. AK1471]|nr:glycosyltransferase family 1 protein [Xylariaceae sp. AK1471]
MPLGRLTAGAVGVILIAFFLSWRTSLYPPASRIPPVVGINNTALFLTTSEYGLSNVHVATAQGLLERYPHIQLHFGSFAPMASRLERVSTYIHSPDKQDIVFHRIEGSSSTDSCRAAGKDTSDAIHPPGWAGIMQRGTRTAYTHSSVQIP